MAFKWNASVWVPFIQPGCSGMPATSWESRKFGVSGARVQNSYFLITFYTESLSQTWSPHHPQPRLLPVESSRGGYLTFIPLQYEGNKYLPVRADVRVRWNHAVPAYPGVRCRGVPRPPAPRDSPFSLTSQKPSVRSSPQAVAPPISLPLWLSAFLGEFCLSPDDFSL